MVEQSCGIAAQMMGNTSEQARRPTHCWHCQVPPGEEKKKRAFVSYKLIAYSTQVSADMDTYMIRQPLGVVGASSCLGLLAIM